MALEMRSGVLQFQRNPCFYPPQHKRLRRRRAVSCRALFCIQGIQIEQIKSWFQNRFEDRKRLIAMDEAETVVGDGNVEFDLDLAVVLAGFAFEAYNSPPENAGIRESDGQKCETNYLSEDLILELYEGQLTVRLEKAVNLPGLDFWGTSDPYVWLRVGDCAKQSKTCWATKDPVWNETLVLNVSDPSTQSLQIAVWDSNILNLPRRLGNFGIPLNTICDGTSHELEMQLEGMGGGGTVHLKVSYKRFDEIEKEEREWKVPFLSDFLKGGGFAPSVFGNEGIKVQDFVGSTVGSVLFLSSQFNDEATTLSIVKDSAGGFTESFNGLADGVKHFLGGFEVKGLQFPSLLPVQDTLKQSGLELEGKAKAIYIEKGLAHALDKEEGDHQLESAALSISEVKKSLVNLSGHVEEVLGSWFMLAAPFIGQVVTQKEEQAAAGNATVPLLDSSQREEMREMFKRAETAMEAWAILATSLGCSSFVKSEFEKVCFLESKNTDTQVSVWRDLRAKRLIVAFRGTEQTKWRDLATDLNLAPTGFNPERVAGDDADGEKLVHTGFLTAYDSVRHRLLAIIKASTADRRNKTEDEIPCKWHIYMTGHSLGGALATLLAMDLSETQMFKRKEVELSMYNFGSPRVGNKAFAEGYNKVIKDSWRIVNHRDIIPTVPRLMGYCHVAHPMYLSSLEEDELLDDVIGEATPVAIVGEFLKGEKQLIDRLLQTEITMLRALRDGTALMQHMEDFYYISLLEEISCKQSVGSKCNVTDICATVSQRVSSRRKKTNKKQISA